MQSTFKKIRTILHHRAAQIGGGIFLLLALFFLVYRLIPSPMVEINYGMDEERKISYQSPLTVRFSQPMDRQSVESHFSVTPSIRGTFSWPDGKTLEFRPAAPLNMDDEYRVTVGADSINLYRKSLKMPVSVRFVVSGPPRVQFISPFLETTASEIAPSEGENIGFVEGKPVQTPDRVLIIAPDQVVTVMFDRPLRALTTLAHSEATQSFPELKIDPPVKGSYRWIGTTAFQFVPERWTMGTTYTLTLPKGISTLDGGTTEEEIAWKLATEAPVVMESQPLEGFDTVLTDEALTLRFNQPMDLDFIRPGDNALLFPSNDSDADATLREDGFFNTEVVYGKDAEGRTDKTVLVFKPEFPFRHNQNYQLVLKAGLPGGSHSSKQGYGDRFMERDFSLNFKTIPLPEIVKWLPANGDRNYRMNTVQITFASPMTDEEVKKRAHLSPAPPEDPIIDLYNYGREVHINYSLNPSADYTFEFTGPFKDAAGNTAAKGFKTSFATAPRPPMVSLLTNDRFSLFAEGLGPVFPVKTVNIPFLDLEFCRLIEADFYSTNQTFNWNNYHCANPSRATVPLSGKPNQPLFTDIDLNERFKTEFGKGIYFFEIKSDDYDSYSRSVYKSAPVRFYRVFFVTDTNLTLKKSDQDLLVWATDLKTGQPVARMDLQILSSSGQELARGVTDGNGLYKISKTFGETIYVVGTKKIGGENRWALVSDNWSSGIQSWQYDSSGEWVGFGESRMHLFTERPLYRPGDEIFFKGIYRLDRDADLRLPEDKKVRVTLEDPDYQSIGDKEVDVLADGSFSGSFTLGPNARLGRYNLYAETLTASPQRFYHNFFVEEYKKPTFKVDILSAKTDYLIGDKINTDVQASYYFGGAISEGKLHWSLMREPYLFDQYHGEGYYSFGGWQGFRCFWGECGTNIEMVAEGEDTLSSDGRTRLILPSDTKKGEPGQSYLYTLNAEVTDKEGVAVAKRETFLVHQGTYYIGLSPKNYLAEKGGRFSVDVISVSTDGTPVPDKRVTLELYRQQWNTVKKQGVDGVFYEENQPELIYVDRTSLTTADDPAEGHFDLKPEWPGGSYRVFAKGSDGNHEVTSETGFYLTSDTLTSWPAANNNRMTLTPDQPEYFVGGKARVMIQSPFGSADEPAKALVTYERGVIQYYEVIDITSGSDTIDIPITESMIPNVYVSAMVVKGGGRDFDRFVALQSQDRMIKQKSDLSARLEQLETDIKTLEASADPSAKYRNAILLSKKQREREDTLTELKAIDEFLKKPKESADTIDFDSIKPDFRLGIVPLKVSKRDHQITIDLKTDKPDYRAGDKVKVEIRTTDYQNRPVPSAVSLAVVDESLLALKANRKISPLDYFYGQRALQVNTSASLTLHADRVNVAAQQGAKGGGGGGEGFDKKRGEFKDTAYFNPLIQTDEGGTATVEFTSPDNLTTWQLWAVASGGTDRFGMATSDFVVKKPISLSPILPRFAISGDRLSVGVLVHNQTDKDTEVAVELIADGFDLKGSAKQSATVKAGDTHRVDWPVTVEPVSVDTAITIEFKSSQDTVVQPLPIHTFAFPETVAVNGTVDDTKTETILIPDTIAPDMGQLIVRVGGNILARFVGAFKALADYPYGCAEQLTSQLLPTLIVERQSAARLDLFDLLNLDKESSHQIVEQTLQKLSGFQRFDGGYGFWEGSDRSNPILSSYILFANHLAKQAGYTVDSELFKRSVDYLWRRLNSVQEVDGYTMRLSPDERMFALWALSEAGQLDTGSTLSLFQLRDELSVYSRALLLMNLKNLADNGQKSVRPLIERLKAEIVSLQISDDRLVHFEETASDYLSLSTNRRTTAMVLMALNRDNSDNPLLPNLVNYLVSSEKNRGFLTNTQETAWLLMAMLEYADAHHTLDADFKFDARLNRDTIADGTITADNLSQVFEASVPIGSLNTGADPNEAVFQKDGTGQLAYDMELHYFLPNEIVPPVEKGFYVSREYFDFNGPNAGKPATTFTSGGLYRGQLDIIAPEDRHYVVVEERLPASFEAINFNLETVDTSLQYKLEQASHPDDETEGDYHWYNNPLWYFNHSEMRDDRVLLFADYLPKGVYTYNFLVRAGLPGTYHHLPASAHQMYFPEVFGRTGGEEVEVK